MMLEVPYVKDLQKILAYLHSQHRLAAIICISDGLDSDPVDCKKLLLQTPAFF